MSQKMPVTGSLIAMFRGYEELHTWEDHESGMVGIIAIHNTNLGPPTNVVADRWAEEVFLRNNRSPHRN